MDIHEKSTIALFTALWQFTCTNLKHLEEDLPPIIKKEMLLRIYRLTDPVYKELECRWLQQAPPVRIGENGMLVTNPDAFARFVLP